MDFVHNEAIPKVEAVNEIIVQYYDPARNTPSVQGTTRMGVRLRFGTVSIRWRMAKALSLNEKFVNELIWREFFMQLLWHQPRLEKKACKKDYDRIRWRNNKAEFARWCKGETGFPDSGCRHA